MCWDSGWQCPCGLKVARADLRYENEQVLFIACLTPGVRLDRSLTKRSPGCSDYLLIKYGLGTVSRTYFRCLDYETSVRQQHFTMMSGEHLRPVIKHMFKVYSKQLADRMIKLARNGACYTDRINAGVRQSTIQWWCKIVRAWPGF